MQVKNAVYLTADKSKAVPEGHPDAATLLVGRNGSISDDVATRLGISEDGAGGQKESAAVVDVRTVNQFAPDGVNTAQGSPAATSQVTQVGVGTDSFGKTIPVANPSAGSAVGVQVSGASAPARGDAPAGKGRGKAGK